MIKYLDLKDINDKHSDEIKDAVERVIDSGWYLKGNETLGFEENYSTYIGSRYCVGCGNGLDALTLIFRAYMEMGIMAKGDEVIIPANTYIASILAVSETGMIPVLVEPRIDTLQIDDSLIEEAITNRTRAIMIVHLYGRCAYTSDIKQLCEKHKLKLIEDNAQAHGCLFEGRRTGSLGDAAAHSFYPTKNLGALGDAGAVTTDDKSLSDVVRSIGNYGSSKKYVFDYIGKNSRMDELQAAVLNVKLKYLDADNARRRLIAKYYIDNIRNPYFTLPDYQYLDHSVFHIFPLLCETRDKLRIYMEDNGVQTDIHYPIPPHKQKCYKEWNDQSFPITEQIHREELSIPVNQCLDDDNIESIVR